MWLVSVGVVLVFLKLVGFGFVAGWPWWGVLAPFAVAAVWWKVADGTGLTQRAAMRREDEKAAKRREAQFEALGLRAPRPGSGAAQPPKPDRPTRSEH